MVLIYNIGSGTEDLTPSSNPNKGLGVHVSATVQKINRCIGHCVCAASKCCTFVADLSQSQSMKHFVYMLRMPTTARTSVRIIWTDDCSNLVHSKCYTVVEVHQTFCVHVQNAYDSRVSESSEPSTAQILCAQNAAWLQKCMKHFVYSTGSEYLRQLRKVSVSFKLLMSLLNLNYCRLSAYQPSRLTAIPNHLTTLFGESWNPQTNTILTAGTAQSTELVKRTC